MSEISRVLLISAPIGSGHVRAAQVVGKAMQKKNPAVEIRLVNVFDFFSPAIGKTILKVYLTILNLLPQAYGMMYGWGNSSKLALLGRALISRYLGTRMRNYIEAFRPQLIVCTHATPAGLVAHLLHKQKINVPTVAVITDLVVHRLWIYPEIDRYFVANESMRATLERYGVVNEKIVISGIPVGEEFTVPVEKSLTLARMGLRDDRKTVLVMGGGAGVLPMGDILQALQALDVPLQIAMICGNNKNLYKKLLVRKYESDCPVIIQGFISNVHEWMAVADIIISKPGGMTSAEALCCGLPMVIYRPIPGQEEANTRQLTECGAAVQADSLAHLQSILQDLLADSPVRLLDMRRRALANSRADAADHIVESIFSHVYS